MLLVGSELENKLFNSLSEYWDKTVTYSNREQQLPAAENGWIPVKFDNPLKSGKIVNYKQFSKYIIITNLDNNKFSVRIKQDGIPDLQNMVDYFMNYFNKYKTNYEHIQDKISNLYNEYEYSRSIIEEGSMLENQTKNCEKRITNNKSRRSAYVDYLKSLNNSLQIYLNKYNKLLDFINNLFPDRVIVDNIIYTID